MIERARQNYAAGSQNLEARAAIWQYPVASELGIPEDWFLDLVDWPRDAVALDAGCGSGRFTEALRRRSRTTIAVDYSLAMAKEVAGHGSDAVGCADVCALPLADASVHVALAAWMLYHAGDIDQACAELRRVVRSDGSLIVVTNGARHICELAEILNEAAERAEVVSPPILGGGRFTFDEAAFFLARWFSSVTIQVRKRTVLLPDPELVVAYVASMNPTESASAERLLAEVRSIATERIERDGSIGVTGLSAAFVCR